MDDQDDWRLTDRLHAPTGKGDPFAAAVRATRMPMLITDPRQADNPIVFVNDAFLALTGYSRQEVLGRNCRFLQGPLTDRAVVAEIREAIARGRDVTAELVNYRKDGEAFWNALYLSPVTDEDGQLLFHFASQVDITARKRSEMEAHQQRELVERAVTERTRALEAALTQRTDLLHEVEHRVKNNLQLISALVLIEQRRAEGAAAQAALGALRERVEALSAVHRLLYREEDVTRFDVAAFVRDYARSATRHHGGGIDLRLELSPVQVEAAQAAPLALLVNELMRIAVARAVAAGPGRAIAISMVPVGARLCRLCVEGADLAQGVEPEAHALIDMLARQLGGKVHWPGTEAGQRICFDIPRGLLERKP